MYLFLRILTAIFSRLPLKAVQAIGRAFGTLTWHIMSERRKVAIINARIVGAENPEKTAKESFKHTFMAFFETTHIPNVDQKFLDRYVTIKNRHHYDKLIEAKQNFAFVSAHLGSWDLVSPVATESLDLKVLTVGRETNSDGMNRFITHLRNTSDKILYIQQFGYMEQINKHSKDGFVPGSLLDHIGTPIDSFFAPFFGMEVETLAGMAVLCARKKMPMLPCYLLRTKDGFVLEPREPIWPNTELKPKERIQDLLVRMNQEFESIIRQYPEQWFLMHRRFKRMRQANGEISRDLYR